MPHPNRNATALGQDLCLLITWGSSKYGKVKITMPPSTPSLFVERWLMYLRNWLFIYLLFCVVYLTSYFSDWQGVNCEVHSSAEGVLWTLACESLKLDERTDMLEAITWFLLGWYPHVHFHYIYTSFAVVDLEPACLPFDILSGKWPPVCCFILGLNVHCSITNKCLTLRPLLSFWLAFVR